MQKHGEAARMMFALVQILLRELSLVSWLELQSPRTLNEKNKHCLRMVKTTISVKAVQSGIYILSTEISLLRMIALCFIE